MKYFKKYMNIIQEMQNQDDMLEIEDLTIYYKLTRLTRDNNIDLINKGEIN